MIFGGGYLVKKYSLSSLGGKVLTILLLFFFMSITIVLFVYHSQVSFWGIFFSVIATLISLFGTFLSFFNGIKIDYRNNTLAILTLKIKYFALQDLSDITVSTKNSIDPKKYCHIVFTLKNGKEYKINGFLSVIKYRDVEKSIQLVDKLNEDLQLYSENKENLL